MLKVPQPRNKLEKEIEKEILHYLNLIPGVFAWKNDTQGLIGPGGRLRARTGFHINGGSDILGCMEPTGQLIALEVKRPGGKVTQAQDAFIAKIRALGGIAGVVYSVHDVERLIKGERAS